MKTCTRCHLEKPLAQFWYCKTKQRHITECDDCRRARGRAYFKAHASERRAAAKAYRLRNLERARAVSRAWQRNNRERYKANQLRWRQARRKELCEYTKRWNKANRERALAAQRACNKKLKDAAYAAYGGYRCKCCGEDREQFLSLDHVNNDGAAHRKVIDRRKLYKWLQREGYPPGFQVLCMNCNFGKARNGGVCPHQTTQAVAGG